MRKQAGVLIGLILALVVASCSSPTEPSTSPTPEPSPTISEPAPSQPKPADPLPIDQVAKFSGVVRSEAGSNCTGTLIDTGAPDGPAYVLTNGHCAGDIGRSAQSTTLGEAKDGTVTFLAAAGNEGNWLTVDVVGLAYSSMRHTDTAILRLKPSLAELVALGIKPIPITASEPAEGSQVVNIGVPVQDISSEDWVLRRGDCKLGSQHTLIESLWKWFGVWSNDCPGIIQGSSGSPLLSLNADGTPKEIVAMINTTTQGTSADQGGLCSINRPCEITPDGVKMVEKTSYAQSVAGVGACFDASGKFAIGGDCPLTVSSIWAEAGGGSFRGGGEPNAFGEQPTARFVGRSEGTFRHKLVPLSDGTACQKPETYADATGAKLPKAGEPWDMLGTEVAVDLPPQEGRYLLCAVAGDDYAGAAGVLFDVDRTPPIFPAGAEVEDVGDGAKIVRPHLNPPEIATVRFTWGDPASIDCSETTEFQDFFIVPLTLTKEELPVRYCVYGMDNAGNRTEVAKIDIP